MNAGFLSKPANIEKVLDQWANVRLWLGFFGEGRKVIDFSAVEKFNEKEFLRNYPSAKKAVEEIRAIPEDAQYFFDVFLARQMSFTGGAALLFRRLKALSPENLIKFLYLISQISRLAKERAGQHCGNNKYRDG